MSIKQGEYLKKLRNDKGISQDALGEALGISRQSVSKWEQGNSTPDIDNIGKLAEFYGVSIDSIVKGEAQDQVQSEEEKKAEAINELIDEFEGNTQFEEKKTDEKPLDIPLSAPEPSLKEKELLKEQQDEQYIVKREKVISRSCRNCILLNRCIYGCKRLENRLDCSFDNSSFLYRCNSD